MTLALVAGGASPVLAATDRGLCQVDESRGKVPDDFPLPACFDGETLVLINDTAYGLVMTASGDDAGKPERFATGGTSNASDLLAFIHPADPGIIPPGYRGRVSIGNGSAKVRVVGVSDEVRKQYLIAEVIDRYIPGGDIPRALVTLVRELAQVGDEYRNCLERNGAWGDVGCSALLGRNVPFAFGRAALNGVGKDAIQAIISLFDTVDWLKATAEDGLKLLHGNREININALPAAPPATPPSETPKPPEGNHNPPVTEAPKEPEAPQPPQPQTAVVQNKHVEGRYALVEDRTSSYLSTDTRTYCADNGCKISGTDMWSGDTLTALCWKDGPEVTNGNNSRTDDDHNEELVKTTKWLKGNRNGHEGFISAAYLNRSSRELNLPGC